MNDKSTFNEVADAYEVQIRGIHGEHTETNDGIFDISNKRRLGKSEKELVQDMINGVKALMEKEMSLWWASKSNEKIRTKIHFILKEERQSLVYWFYI